MNMTVKEFAAALKLGPYAWPGGYPMYFLMADGEPLSFKSAKTNAKRIVREIRDGDDDQWIPIAFEVNWEDPELYCADSGERIESAYADG